MDEFRNPDDRFSPEEMDKILKRAAEMTNLYNDLVARLEQNKKQILSAAGGITPKQEALQRVRNELLCQEIDAVQQQLRDFQPILEEAIEVIGNHLMASTDRIYQKIKEASKDDPAAQEELRELDELHDKIFEDEEDDDDWWKGE